MNMLEKGAPLPESLGRCADFYHVVRTLRLAMEKEVEAVKARETEIKSHLIDNLSKSQDTGVAGLTHRAQIVVKSTFKVTEWPILWSWIRKNDRFDCLQKRLNETAAKDFFEAEKRPIPGCEEIRVPDVSIQKI